MPYGSLTVKLSSRCRNRGADLRGSIKIKKSNNKDGTAGGLNFFASRSLFIAFWWWIENGRFFMKKRGDKYGKRKK